MSDSIIILKDALSKKIEVASIEINSNESSKHAVELFGRSIVARLDGLFNDVGNYQPHEQGQNLANGIQLIRNEIFKKVEVLTTDKVILRAKLQCYQEFASMIDAIIKDSEENLAKEQRKADAVLRVSEKISSGDYVQNEKRAIGERPERLSHVRHAQSLGSLSDIRGPK